MQKDDIAIIGMGCRFPGKLNDVESFWKFLLEGREAVEEVPSDRWNIERFYDAEPGLPGKTIAKWGGFVEGLEEFDPQFFGISPREAPYIDPQQRLLLETAYEAMESAGLVLDIEGGSDVGVYVGISHTDYQSIQGSANDRTSISPHSPTGNAHSIAANRISYCFNLLGPSLAMDTACSSALSAVHVACEELQNGRCETALVGGVTVMIIPDGFIGFSQAGMLSPDGRCKAFDADANGFVRGEGAGMVVLKPLSKAIEDGDTIHAVIRATGANQDGHTNGISLPGEDAQRELVKDCCAGAGIDPLDIGYVEAHGTGTAVGDPIEAHALAAALCKDRPEDSPLPIGSVKTNLGHLETAAGVAGLIKAALVVSRGQIPPSLHFTKPSPHIDFDKCKLRVPTETEPFPDTGGKPRIAAVNSFGFGGANAHVILSEPPAAAKAATSVRALEVDRSWPVMLSARSEESLKASAEQLADWIEEHTSGNGTSPILPDLVHTLGARRNHHPYRLTTVAKSMSDLVSELRAHSEGEAGATLQTSFTPTPEQPLRVGFVMSGQGPQWWGMGRELMRAEPVFREAMEACAAAMEPHANFSLLEELGRDEADSRLQQTEIGQPAIFAMQYALAKLWNAWGVKPTAITGHSVGEIAAACVAGILTMEEAARIIVLRAQVMHECARGDGTMLAIGVSEEDAEDLIARHGGTDVSIAAFNGPQSLTLSGPKESLQVICDELEAKEVFARFVRVDHPFHHAFMQPAADAMEAALADLVPSEESTPFFSTVSGKRAAGKDCTADHWARGIRQPVQFTAAVDAMNDNGVDVWLEISAHPALAMALRECLAGSENKAQVVASTRREREQEAALESALELHRLGVTLDFSAMTPSRRLLTMPTYPWNKETWWHESPELRRGRLSPGGKGLLDQRLPRATPTWTTRLDERHLSYLRDHQVDTHIIFPAAAFVEMTLDAGIELFEGRPFAIEDFEIRKPLILSDPPEGLLLELSYDLTERTFAIQSRVEPSPNWSVHVVGSIRAERVESSFSDTTWQAPAADQDSVPTDEFYDYMAGLGLRYGPEFKPVKELNAAGGKSSGKVSLTEKSAERVGVYALHPVLMDGALHVFSAGARTVEDRRAGMKLPVRFARILFLQSPGKETHVNASVLQCNDELIEGRIGLYNTEGEPCVLVDGFRAIAMSNVRKAGSSAGGRDVVYHVDWERSPTGRAKPAIEPAPLKDLYDAADTALNDVLSMRGKDRLEAVMAAEDDLAAAQVAHGLIELGVDPKGKTAFTADTLGVSSTMDQVFPRLMEKMTARGLLETAETADGESGWCATPGLGEAAGNANEELRKFFTMHPGHLPEGTLLESIGGDFASILRGETDAVQTLFAGPGADVMEQFYGDGLLASHWMAGIAATVKEAADRLPEGRGLRVLEVGSGTGGLAAYILPHLQGGLHRYTFTDVSAGFFPPAQKKLATFPEVDYEVFNLDEDPAEQGFEPETYDFVVCTNVLHAVADVREALAKLHTLLRPGGTLAFMDIATPQLWIEASFGLTGGWWQFTDKDLRPEQPLMSRDEWETALQGSGFEATLSLPGLHGPSGGEGQIGLLARKKWAPHEVPADIPTIIEDDTAEEVIEESDDADSAAAEAEAEAEAEPLAEVEADADAEAATEAEAADEDEEVIEHLSAEDIEPESSWVLFADDTGVASKLAASLEAADVRCRIVRKGGAFASTGDNEFEIDPASADDWEQLFAAWSEDEPPQHYVYLWPLDESTILPSGEDEALMGIDALLLFAQTLEKVLPAGGVRVDMVTRGAQATGKDRFPVNVVQAPAIGLFRVVRSEQPNLTCRAIDLGPESTDTEPLMLWDELLRKGKEREVALRGECRYVPRLTRGAASSERTLTADVPLRLESRERGILDSLQFTPFALPEVGKGEVLIKVKAAGMNFRDVLKALALYPAETADARMFGDEVGGEVVAIGEGVDHVAVGDKVFGLAVFGLATHTLTRGADVVRLPDNLTFEEAATLPVVFMTAWHALKKAARIAPGETVLVHAGAGGVGMAAIQIAHHLGAKVIASAGSPAKRALLKTLGVAEVIDSRRGDFAEKVMELTDRKGVDIVLNALASEAIPMGLSCLAEYGRFIEIGKRDIYQNSKLPLWGLRRNASFHVVAMDAVFAGDEELTRELLGEIADLVAEGALTPLPYRTFPATRVDAAFRLMAAGKHTGKVVIAFADAFIRRCGEPPRPPFQVDSDATYLITGGLGGFGRVLSMWLAENGAKHLVLTGRSGAASEEAQAFISELADLGVEALPVAADVSSEDSVKDLFAEVKATGRPLKGIFHLAMVIDDAPLADLTAERFKSVMGPKSHGGWLLHEHSRDCDLDAFVLFSSISSIFGNPAQGNYSAANAFLDALAHHRHALGLPATTVNWGVLGGEGYVARNTKVAEFLARQGTGAIEPGEVTALLESFIESNVPQTAAIRVDWALWRQSFRAAQENPIMERVFAAGLESDESGGGGGDWRARIDAASPEDRGAVVVQAVQDVIGTVLRVKPDTLREDQPLTDLGLDSLMGVEIENLIESSIGVTLPPTSLMRARTIGQIATLISSHLGGDTQAGVDAAEAATAAPVEEEELSMDDVDLDALSGADIDRLLDAPSAEDADQESEDEEDEPSAEAAAEAEAPPSRP